MGRDIPNTTFSKEDYDAFHQRLKAECVILNDWFKREAFESNRTVCGFELEAWLTDERHLPAPVNEEFLSRMPSSLVVPELAKFNFEINSTPQNVTGNVFTAFEKELREVWTACEQHTASLSAQPLAIGILPTVTDEWLTLENMSSLRRYYALNQQVMTLRREQPIHMVIEGADSIDVVHHDVMLESAATSLQIHLQVDPKDSVRVYNACQVLSAPMVAVSANSPYLFGRDLWDETRIPVFEQAVSVASFKRKTGDPVGRVTFGTGYCRESMFEPFLENLDGFPILLPMVFDDDPNWLSHLRLHNGTIWRWNRPLIGLGPDGTPHLRIEHRTPAAGPSIPDTIANLAFFIGMALFYGRGDKPLEEAIPFEVAHKNFYDAARFGLNAPIRWNGGAQLTISQLILDELIPAARMGLISAGVDAEDVHAYIDGIIQERVQSGQNGARWQRGFIQKYGKDFQSMTKAYAENQKSLRPVHEWAV